MLAFRTLQAKLVSRPILAYPDEDLEFELFVDASEYAVGSCLIQRNADGSPRVISYNSRTLAKHEKSYSAYVAEQLACVYGIQVNDQYLRGTTFKLWTDNRPVLSLSKQNSKTLNRLQLLMLEYNFTLHHVPGISNPSDFLSRNVAVSTIQAVGTDLHFGKQSIRLHQSKDDFCIDMANYLAIPRPPPNVLQPRLPPPPIFKPRATPIPILQKFAEACTLRGSILYFTMSSPDKITRSVPVLPNSLQAQLLNDAHASVQGGHAKYDKTLQKILDQAWWPTLHADILDLLKRCHACQKSARPQPYPTVPLGMFELPTMFNEHVSCDLFGPLKAADNSKKYIQVITDKFSNFTVFAVVANKTPEAVAHCLIESWVKIFSLPSILMSDRGSEYTAAISEQLMDLLRIDRRYTTTANPKCNAASETRNKHIISYLKSALLKHPTDWESLVPYLTMAWNSGTANATKMSPHFLVYNSYPKTPFLDPNLTERVFYGSDYPAFVAKRLQSARSLALANRRIYQDKYADRYNKKLKPYNFALQQLVLLHAPESRTAINPKIQSPFIGPFRIIALPQPQTAVLQNCHSHKTKHVNVARIRPYVPPFVTQNSSLPTHQLSHHETRAQSAKRLLSLRTQRQQAKNQDTHATLQTFATPPAMAGPIYRPSPPSSLSHSTLAGHSDHTSPTHSLVSRHTPSPPSSRPSPADTPPPDRPGHSPHSIPLYPATPRWPPHWPDAASTPLPSPLPALPPFKSDTSFDKQRSAATSADSFNTVMDETFGLDRTSLSGSRSSLSSLFAGDRKKTPPRPPQPPIGARITRGIAETFGFNIPEPDYLGHPDRASKPKSKATSTTTPRRRK